MEDFAIEDINGMMLSQELTIVGVTFYNIIYNYSIGSKDYLIGSGNLSSLLVYGEFIFP